MARFETMWYAWMEGSEEVLVLRSKRVNSASRQQPGMEKKAEQRVNEICGLQVRDTQSGL